MGESSLPSTRRQQRPPALCWALLFVEAEREVRRLRRVRGVSRRTQRRLARAAATMLAAAALLGIPVLARPAAAATPNFENPFNPFGLSDVGDYSAPAFADIDGDGDLDALIGEEDGNTVFFENTGNASVAAFAASVTNPFGLAAADLFSHPAFVDIDGDGDLDALIGSFSRKIAFQENTGSAMAPAFAAPVIDPFGLDRPGYSPTFVDIDGDGDLDAFTGEAGYMYLQENTGSATAPAFAAPVKNPFGLVNVDYYESNLAFVDIDGDGDLDALIGGFDGNVVFQENTGSATAPAFSVPQSNPFGLASLGNARRFDSNPAFVDIDGDSDFDAFVGGIDGNVTFQENTGSATAPAFAAPQSNPFGLVSIGYGGRLAPAFADIDGDGDLDAWIGGSLYGNIVFQENTGSRTAPAFAAEQSNPFGLAAVYLASGPAFADIDGDGDLDALIGDGYGRTAFQENTGNATNPAFAAPLSNPFGLAVTGSYARPAFVDIDGDGDLDALFGEDYEILFQRNTGNATAPAFAVPVTNPFGLAYVGDSSPAFVDIDGDGDLDFLIGDYYGDIVFQENTGSATAPAFAVQVSNPFNLVGLHSRYSTGASPAFVDIDGDGDLDGLIGLGTRYVGQTIFFENRSIVCPGAPSTSCSVPQRSVLFLKDSDDDSRDRIRFSFIRGATPLEGADFGDPALGEAYLCIYENGALSGQARAPVSAQSWKALRGDKGFAYKDRLATTDGTKKVVLRAGPAGSPREPKVIWIGKGASLPDPVVPVSEPIDVTAQVVSPSGACFGDTFTAALKNKSNPTGTLRIFKARNRR